LVVKEQEGGQINHRFKNTRLIVHLLEFASLSQENNLVKNKKRANNSPVVQLYSAKQYMHVRPG